MPGGLNRLDSCRSGQSRARPRLFPRTWPRSAVKESTVLGCTIFCPELSVFTNLLQGKYSFRLRNFLSWMSFTPLQNFDMNFYKMKNTLFFLFWIFATVFFSWLPHWPTWTCTISRIFPFYSETGYNLNQSLKILQRLW